MSTVDLAKSIGQLTGYVRNTTHDSVQGEVQSESQSSIDEFMRELKGVAGRVDQIDYHEIEVKAGEHTFKATR